MTTNFKHAIVQTPYGKALLGINFGSIGTNGVKISALLFLTFEAEKMLGMFHKKFPKSVEISGVELQNLADDIFKNRGKYLNKIDLHGTDFQKSVWLELMKLSEATPYQQIAKNICTNGVRAVASAIAHNPIHYVIPCHLAVRSDGSLGKFAGGSELKQKLIEEFCE